MSRGTSSGTDVVAPMASAISSDPGAAAPDVVAHLGQVLLEQPEAGVELEVDGQDDPPRRDAAQLGQPAAGSSQWWTVRIASATAAHPEAAAGRRRWRARPERHRRAAGPP